MVSRRPAGLRICQTLEDHEEQAGTDDSTIYPDAQTAGQCVCADRPAAGAAKD